MPSITLTSDAYTGRYLQAVISQDGTTKTKINWTLYVKGDEGVDYTTGPTTLKIGDDTVYYCDRWAWNEHGGQFPCRNGEISGSTYVSKGTTSVYCYLTTAVYKVALDTHDGTLYLDNTYNAPYYTSINASSITRTSAYLSGEVNTDGASITDGGWDVSTNGGSSWTYYSGGPTGKTITGLSSNTTYWYRGYVVTAGGSANSSWGTFKTTHNNPSIGNRTFGYSRASSNLNSTYTVTFTYSVTYDNASYSSRKIEYGTSIHYGSQVTNTKTISGLSPNTTYYYRITETDNSNGSGTATGSFTTPGVAPVINSVTFSPNRTVATFSESISYDTNASFSSRSLRYGTTTSYGSSTTGTSLSGLTPNQTYYYSLTIVDNKGYTSSAYTGSFITTGNAPTFNTASVSEITSESAKLTFGATADTNASISSYTLYKNDGTLISSNSTGIFNLIELDSDTLYTYYCIATDSFNRATTSSNVSFTTLTKRFIHKVTNNSNDLINVYGIGDLKNFLYNTTFEIGGLQFSVGRTYQLACVASIDTDRVRSALISISDTGLSKNNYCFMRSKAYNWKIQHYDSNMVGLSEETGGVGEACVLQLIDPNGYLAVEVEGTDINDVVANTDLFSCGRDDLIDIINNNKKIIKEFLPTDLVKVSKYMRYIDVGMSGNSQNAGNHICELEVYDVNGVNRALGVVPTAIKGTLFEDGTNITRYASTDGDTSSTKYTEITGKDAIYRYDLGAIYEIDYVKLWRYYADNRKYYKTFVYGRAGNRVVDGLNDKELCYKFHDYKRDGIYEETSSGKIWYVNKEPIDNVNPIINSFTVNTTSWTNQGVILTILAEDNNGTRDLIYSFDGGTNWTRNNHITVLKNKTYTAIVKDKQGNVSTTNPTITVENIDTKPPSTPVMFLRYENASGEEYDGSWTNRNIYVDNKIGRSSNLCPSIIEHGYISKETGEDNTDKTKIREVTKMDLYGSGDTLYIQRYNKDGATIRGTTTVFYYREDEYLSYIDVDYENPFLSIPTGATHIRLADTTNNLNVYYMIAQSDIAVPFEIYYNVTDDLSGIEGWYYRNSLSSDTYLQMPSNTIFTDDISTNMYIVTRDNAGNNSAYIFKEIHFDKTKPRDIRFSYTKNGNNLEIVASAVDDISGIRGYKFSIDGGRTWSSEQSSNTYRYTGLNGIYDVKVRVYDNATNYDDSVTQIIIVGDISAYPKVTGSIGNPINWTNQNPTISIVATIGELAPSGTTIQYYSFDNGITWDTNNSITVSENQLLYARVEDSNGRRSDTFVIDVNKIDKVPPTLNPPLEPTLISITDNVNFWDGVTYYDNDSGINESSKSTNPTSTRDFDVGDNRVELSISDNAGNTSTKYRIYRIRTTHKMLEQFEHIELEDYTHKQIEEGDFNE